MNGYKANDGSVALRYEGGEPERRKDYEATWEPRVWENLGWFAAVRAHVEGAAISVTIHRSGYAKVDGEHCVVQLGDRVNGGTPGRFGRLPAHHDPVQAVRLALDVAIPEARAEAARWAAMADGFKAMTGWEGEADVVG